MHWNRTKAPTPKSVMPMTEAIQWTSLRDVQAKRKRPAGRHMEAKIAGTSLCSWARGPRLRMSGFCRVVSIEQGWRFGGWLTR